MSDAFASYIDYSVLPPGHIDMHGATHLYLKRASDTCESERPPGRGQLTGAGDGEKRINRYPAPLRAGADE